RAPQRIQAAPPSSVRICDSADSLRQNPPPRAAKPGFVNTETESSTSGPSLREAGSQGTSVTLYVARPPISFNMDLPIRANDAHAFTEHSSQSVFLAAGGGAALLRRAPGNDIHLLSASLFAGYLLRLHSSALPAMAALVYSAAPIPLLRSRSLAQFFSAQGPARKTITPIGDRVCLF